MFAGKTFKNFNSSNLIFYQVVFENFERCPYVDVLKRKLERSVLCSLTLKSSSHNLAIE